MKKTIKLAVLALATLTMGSVMTSCDEVTNLIQQLFNPGETYTYTGTGEAYTMNGSSKTGEWQLINENKTALTSAQVVLKCGSNTGTITLPNITDGKASMQNGVIYNLALNNENASKTTFDFGENTSIDGSLVIDGKTYTAANLYIEQEKTYVTTTKMVLEFSIYFDDDEDGDYSKVVNFTYEGAAASE